MVVQKGLSIYKASKKMGINNATAKVIIKKFKDQGAVFRRKS